MPATDPAAAMGWHASVCGRQVALLVHRQQTWAYAEAGTPLPFDPRLSIACEECLVSAAALAEAADQPGAAGQEPTEWARKPRPIA
ncbi:hypothetical protein [Nonomuraea endophytica]|uniref:hypothetical protein n=1 Tax=Nonomuraea endophytica TaxID=714136 RepID=UPI0037C8A16E